MIWLAVWLVVLGASGFAGAGAAGGGHLAPCRRAIACALGLGVAAGVAILVIDGPDGVSGTARLEGAALAAGLVAGTALLYVALGALLHRRHRVLVAVTLCSVPLLLGGAFGGLLMVADLALCAPDAYECPL